ncbi:MAG: MATE family efflux transporter [Firmicutes bacterium]|nr:MATE family efflux transporter [Bacillota bacterium]
MERNLELKQFSKYVSLNILGMLGVSCYILADTFFIAKGMGTLGLAALNIAIPAFNLVGSFGLMLGIGGATRFTIAKSRGDAEEAEAVFNNTFAAVIVVAILFELAGFFLCSEIVGLLGADESTFDMTYTYLRMLFLFSPFFLMNNIFMAFVRNDGDPNLSMTAQLVGSFANIILDYVFIFPLQMGIFGAVLATCLSPIISLTILLLHKLKGNNNFHLKKIKVQSKRLAAIASLGTPSFVTEISGGLVIMIFNIIILGIEGNTGVAAYGVVANVSIVVTAIFNGIAQGSQPLISHAYGSSNSKAIKKYMKYAIVAVALISAAIYAVVIVFAQPITSVFNSENNYLLQEIAETGLKIYFAASFFVGFNIFVAIYFSSSERALPAQIISLARGIVLIVPMAFLLSNILGMTGVWLSYPATEAVVSIIAIIFLKYRRV